MKFLFEYQDKANKRHKGALNAATRADAYAQLRQRGIKPIRCDEAPGFFNLVFGKGKRWLAIAILAVACVVLAVIIHSTPTPSTYTSFDSPIRRQIIGDAAIIEKGIRTGWAEVFDAEADRFLASFAIPGVPPAVRTTTEEKLREALDNEPSKHPNLPNIQTALEARQIRAMVSGMKDEMRRFIAAGGTIREYGERLVARQEQEIGYYNRAKQEIDFAAKEGLAEREVLSLWEKRNASLRKMGIRLVSMPE